MIDNGLRWLNEHPSFSFDGFGNYKNIIGVMNVPDTNEAKEFDWALTKDVPGGCTGAMHQYAANHCYFIHKNGWEKYLAEFEDSRKFHWDGSPYTCPAPKTYTEASDNER